MALGWAGPMGAVDGAVGISLSKGVVGSVTVGAMVALGWAGPIGAVDEVVGISLSPKV